MIKSVLTWVVDNSVAKLARLIRHRLKIEHGGAYKHNLHSLLWERATIESADYVEKHLSSAMVFNEPSGLWDYIIQYCDDSDASMMMEFGVFEGNSLNYFASRMRKTQFYGFDSFEGLQEDWYGHHAPKSFFSRNGKMPKVEKNVVLIKGWFDQTLQPFVADSMPDKKLALLHIDSDTYEAAKCILECLKEKIQPGLFVLFDEYIGYPSWKTGEFLAWREFCAANGIKYRYRGFSTEQALVEII